MHTNTPRKRVTVITLAFASMIASTTSGAIFAATDESPAIPPPTANQIVDQFQRNGGVFPGYRRNHAKGVCVSGYFQSSGNAAHYSVAQVFAADQRTPVVGRFSIPGTNPYAWDDSTPIRGMALVFLQAGGQQWRTAMNAVPVFPVATPEANQEFMQMQQPIPASGIPDPEKLAGFFAAHSMANRFRIWDETTKPSASFVTERYNSLNTFMLVDTKGHRQAVRWSMTPEVVADTAIHAPADKPDYLAADLRQRLSRGALRWKLVFTLANLGDPIDDATQAWPPDHRQIDAGMLVIQSSQSQSVGACRDINFNPLVLPAGIEPSRDPLLEFRAEAYAESHQRRVGEEIQTHNATGGVVSPLPSDAPLP